MLQARNAFRTFLLYSKLHALVPMVTPAMLAYRNPLYPRYFPTKFHENLPISSKVIMGTHKQAGDVTSLLSFLNESRLKNEINVVTLKIYLIFFYEYRLKSSGIS
jgi:hypothetical protein